MLGNRQSKTIDDENDEADHRHAVAPVVPQRESERRQRLAADALGLVAQREAGEVDILVGFDRVGDLVGVNLAGVEFKICVCGVVDLSQGGSSGQGRRRARQRAGWPE